MDISNCDGIELLKKLLDKSIDLILTDPPYIISRNSGMNKFAEDVKKIEKEGKTVKKEEEWEEYKIKNKIKNDLYKENYLNYGNSSGKKYGYKNAKSGGVARGFTSLLFEKNKSLSKVAFVQKVKSD